MESVRSYQGFTFVEIMVVIAIIGIMTAISLVFMRDSSTEGSLESETRKLASTLRGIQDNALIGTRRDATKPSCGFGLGYVASASEWKTYVILRRNTWADCTNPAISLELDESASSDVPIMEIWPLGSGVTLEITDVENGGTVQDIAFSVPFANIFSYDNSGPPQTLTAGGTIQFKLSFGGEDQYVCVERGSGQVVENGDVACL